MRTYLLPLAVALLFAVAPARAEFDAGPANAKAKASGATFTAAVAASKRIRAANDFQLFLTGLQPLVFAVPPPGFVVVGGLKAPAPQPNIKSGSNIPRPRHPKPPDLSGY